jgi:hypothetical protein
MKTSGENLSGPDPFDEAWDPEQSNYFHNMSRAERRRAAKFGWPNWYINRGRISNPPTKKELRQLSHRRAH